MSYFPFFVEVDRLQGVIIGGGRIALEKVERLLTFQAKIKVISLEFHEELLQYGDRIELVKKAYEGSDLDTADYVIAATNIPQLNKQVYEAARQRKLLVNVVDVPEQCDFIFPSVLQKGKLVVGVSSSGAGPQVTKRLRDEFSNMLPENIEEILDFLAEERIRAKASIPDGEARRKYLIELADKMLHYEK